jgi:hypothetical protein
MATAKVLEILRQTGIGTFRLKSLSERNRHHQRLDGLQVQVRTPVVTDVEFRSRDSDCLGSVLN